MKPMTLLTIAMLGMAGLGNGQTPAQPAPAPKQTATVPPAATAAPAVARPAAPKAPVAPKTSPQVERVIEMAKNGMSEAFIIKDLQKANTPVNLSPADMGRLKQAGVSETVMSVMQDPGGAVPGAQSAAAPEVVAAAPRSVPQTLPEAAAPGAAPARDASSGEAAMATVSAPAADGAQPPARALKKRVIVDPFDYSAVMTAVQTVFGTQQNIGKGIQAMMVTRLHQGDKLVIVDRTKVKEVEAEQDNNASNRNKQGTGARIGRISGADAIIAGDIVIFGHDDKKKSAGAAFVGGFCKLCGAVAASKKEEKFVVAINYRLIDAETTEVIATGEARGESKRTSTNWAGIGAALGTGAGAAVDMSSSNFAETIVGEATQDCVNKLAEILNKQAADMKKTVREVEAFVADISGNSITITAGSGDGVNLGEIFEIMRVDREVKDPVTNEVLDRITTKVGEMTVNSVRDKIATGTYTGAPAAVKYVARKKLPPQQ